MWLQFYGSLFPPGEGGILSLILKLIKSLTSYFMTSYLKSQNDLIIINIITPLLLSLKVTVFRKHLRLTMSIFIFSLS